MRDPLTFLASSALVLGSCLGLTGCARAPSEAPTAAPIPVTVSYPVERYVKATHTSACSMPTCAACRRSSGPIAASG